MRKWKPEEVLLFVVPLAIVPLALLLTQLKPEPVPPAQPQPTVQVKQDWVRAVPSATPEPTPTEPPRAKSRLNMSARYGAQLMVASRDGRTLYTYGGGHPDGSGSMEAWDARTRIHRRSFNEVAGPCPGSTLHLSPDGGTLYYQAWRGGSLRSRYSVLMDVRSGRQHQFAVRPEQDIFHVGLGRGVFASALVNAIELRSLRDGRVTGYIRLGKAGAADYRPEMLGSSPDGSLLSWIANRAVDPDLHDGRSFTVTGGALVVYSLSRKRRVFSRALPDYNIREVAISGDNTKVIALTEYNPDRPKFSISRQDRKLLIFDLRSGRLQHRLNLGSRNGVGLQPSPDGKWLALQSGNFLNQFNTADWVQIVNLSSGQATVFPDKHTYSGTTFSADSRELFIFGSGHSLQLAPDARWHEVPS